MAKWSLLTLTLKDQNPKEEEQRSKYALEDHSGDPISSDDFDVPSKTEQFFDAVKDSNSIRRHQSVRMERNDAFTEEI